MIYKILDLQWNTWFKDYQLFFDISYYYKSFSEWISFGIIFRFSKNEFNLSNEIKFKSLRPKTEKEIQKMQINSH